MLDMTALKSRDPFVCIGARGRRGGGQEHHPERRAGLGCREERAAG